jgi:hypothetical protein
LAKIIDYGRCYYEGNNTFFDVPNSDCLGFMDSVPNPRNSYITMKVPNVSHDLRLINSLKGVNFFPELNNIINMVKYDGNYGTPAIYKSGLSKNKIMNVVDAFTKLKELAIQRESINNGDFRDIEVAGHMNTYCDDSGRKVEFVTV